MSTFKKRKDLWITNNMKVFSTIIYDTSYDTIELYYKFHSSLKR